MRHRTQRLPALRPPAMKTPRKTAARRACALAAAVLLAAALGGPGAAFAAEETEPEPASSAYCVIDADSGQLLLQQNADEAHYPASITKIMTAALVLEACGEDWSPAVTASEAAIAAVGPGSTMISLRPGETLSLADLLYALMLESANDAANVLAEYVDGSLDAFVARMNEKARELGMEHTRFVNPSGYHAEGHVTTAHDMARATQWALTVPGFRRLIGTHQRTVPATNLTPYPRELTNDNRLLLPGAQYYEGLIGGKSGWTPEARYTMVETALRDGCTLIAVVMDCPRAADRYADCALLLDDCFARYRRVTLDTEALELPAVPVWSGGRRVGEVQLTASSSILLEKSATLANMRVELEIPRWYVYGVEFDAAATLWDTVTGERLCVVPLVPDADALQAVLGSVPAERALRPLSGEEKVKIMLGGFLLAVLAVFTSRYAARAAEVRRSASRRAIGRLRGRLPVAERQRDKAAQADARDAGAPEQADAAPPARHGPR